MPHPLWQQIASAAGTPLGEAQLSRLDAYLDGLIEWNQRLNLTRIVDREDAEVRHVGDALTVLEFLLSDPRYPGAEARSPVTLADVGTGGGVPGVPLAIARPDWRVTLIDSTKKKLGAIEKIVAAIGVANVSTLHARIESVRATFDIITARAVADLATLIGWCEPLMHPNSVMLAMKGPKAMEEIAATPQRMRERFVIEHFPVEFPGLTGHCVVRITRAGSRRTGQKGADAG